MTGTTGPGRTRRERRAETVLQPMQATQAMQSAPPVQAAGEPIFARLASEWEGAGRTVPGRPDAEWTRLATPPQGGGGRPGGVSRLAPP